MCHSWGEGGEHSCEPLRATSARAQDRQKSGPSAPAPSLFVFQFSRRSVFKSMHTIFNYQTLLPSKLKQEDEALFLFSLVNKHLSNENLHFSGSRFPWVIAETV